MTVQMTRMATLRRAVLAALAVALVAGCGTQAAPAPVTVEPVVPRPAGEADAKGAPIDADCGDREASLRPGDVPSGASLARIRDRGRLIVGVDQSQYLFGFRNPETGEMEGFDVDVARQIARAIFGNPDQIEFRVVSGAEREKVLQSGDVDIVVRTYSITCKRKEDVAFSTTYFYAEQRILVLKDSGIESVDDLSGKTACAVQGTTSAGILLGLESQPKVVGTQTWPDCLVMLQQGQIDAIGTDGVVLAGLAAQDPNTVILGPSLSREPYGVGVKKENEDLVRFVNGVLDDMRTDGTWEALYTPLIPRFGPSPGPPTPRYVD